MRVRHGQPVVFVRPLSRRARHACIPRHRHAAAREPAVRYSVQCQHGRGIIDRERIARVIARIVGHGHVVVPRRSQRARIRRIGGRRERAARRMTVSDGRDAHVIRPRRSHPAPRKPAACYAVQRKRRLCLVDIVIVLCAVADLRLDPKGMLTLARYRCRRTRLKFSVEIQLRPAHRRERDRLVGIRAGGKLRPARSPRASHSRRIARVRAVPV